MISTYYSAVWTDSGCLLSCWHEHSTINEAAACISNAGVYVVASENGVLRALTADEEAEFQRAISEPPSDKPALDAIRAAQERYRNDGTRYAVMVRIRVAGHYTWTTWMTYGTYGEAAARAGIGHRIVAFGSPQWVELQKHTEPARTNEERKECKDPTLSPDGRGRCEGETLVESMKRFLDAYGVSQSALADEENNYSRFARWPVRAQMSGFVGFAVNWLTRWETRELERIYTLQVPPWLEGLGKRVRRVLKHEGPSRR